MDYSDTDISGYQKVLDTEIEDYLSFDANEPMKLKHGELVKNTVRDAINAKIEDDKIDIECMRNKADKEVRLKQIEFEQEKWKEELELRKAQAEQDRLDREQQRRINDEDVELRKKEAEYRERELVLREAQAEQDKLDREQQRRINEEDLELRKKEAEHREYVDLENLKIKREEMSNYDKLMNRQFSWQKEADEKRLILEQQRLIEDQRHNKASKWLELAKVGVLGVCGYHSIKKGFELGMNGLNTDLNGYNESPATLKLGESMINSSNKFTHF